jgi:hypothetical protein
MPCAARHSTSPLNAQFMQGQIQGPFRSDINLQATTGFAFPTTIAASAYLKESLRLAESEKLGTTGLCEGERGRCLPAMGHGLEQVRQCCNSSTARIRPWRRSQRSAFELGETGRLERPAHKAAPSR